MKLLVLLTTLLFTSISYADYPGQYPLGQYQYANPTTNINQPNAVNDLWQKQQQERYQQQLLEAQQNQARQLQQLNSTLQQQQWQNNSFGR